MSIIPFRGEYPKLDSKSYIADGARVIGHTELKEFSSVWYNCVLRGDVNRIEVGRYSNIQDGSIVHNDDNHPALIGDYVTVGHNCIIHGCTIEDHCLIGMGAIVLSGAVIGRGSIIGAGAVVKEGAVIPPFSLVVGIPGKVMRTNDESIITTIHSQALKYKTLWTDWYGFLPNPGGEVYNNEPIV